MATVTLYQFEIYHADTRRWRKDERMATLDAIRALGGVPQHSSSMVVDETRVDAQGFLRVREPDGQSA